MGLAVAITASPDRTSPARTGSLTDLVLPPPPEFADFGLESPPITSAPSAAHSTVSDTATNEAIASVVAGSAAGEGAGTNDSVTEGGASESSEQAELDVLLIVGPEAVAVQGITS